MFLAPRNGFLYDFFTFWYISFLGPAKKYDPNRNPYTPRTCMSEPAGRVNLAEKPRSAEGGGEAGRGQAGRYRDKIDSCKR